MARFHPADEAIDRRARQFLAATLPKAEWTHAAHFATCLWILTFAPEILPERDLPHLIRRYNEAVGGVNSDTAGYHETITQASIRAARAARLAQPDADVATVLATLLAGECGRSDWPLRYWSRARLFSVEARRQWCDPDLAPLPY
jgi:hypothetical protein